MSKSLSTVQVEGILRRRYAAPEWALLENVRNKTGYSGNEERYADAVAMSLYPSRGLQVLGFEIKVSRNDWIKELKSPDKSVAVQKYCDFWWIVAGGPNIVNKDELPLNWGLMVCGNGKLNILVDAPRLEASPLDRSFVASMMRRMHENIASSVISPEQVHDAFERGKATGELSRPQEEQQLKYELELLRRQVKDFESMSGFKIDSWEWQGLVQVLKKVQNDVFKPEPERAYDHVRKMLESSLDYVKAMETISTLVKEGAVTIPPP